MTRIQRRPGARAFDQQFLVIFGIHHLPQYCSPIRVVTKFFYLWNMAVETLKFVSEWHRFLIYEMMPTYQ